MQKNKIATVVLAGTLISQANVLTVSALENEKLTNESGYADSTNKVIEFQDENLRKGIMENLKISDSNELTEDKLKKIEKIDLSNRKIENLDGIEFLINLENINLSNNDIKDISKLGNLLRLTDVSLNNNKIEDASVLGELYKKQLDIYEKNDRKRILKLDLDNNRIFDISGLKNFTIEKMFIHIPSLSVSNQNININKYVNIIDKEFKIGNNLKNIKNKLIRPNNIENNGEYEDSDNKIIWRNLENKPKDLKYEFNEDQKLDDYGRKMTFSGSVNINLKYNNGSAPIINIDKKEIDVEKGSKFDIMSGVTATDKKGAVDSDGNLIDKDEKDEDITSKIICKNEKDFDINKVGKYELFYEVEDGWGNKAEESRIVNVIEHKIPSIPSNPFIPDKNSPTIEDITGENRFETALKISDMWSSSDNLILTNANSIVDSMTATPLAHLKNAPILLTKKTEIPKEVKNKINKLNVKTVYLIGGTNVLDENIEKELKDMNIKFVRISGKDRFETSMNIAKEIDKNKDISKISVVNGFDGLADSVSISSPSAINNTPILLTNNEGNINYAKEFIKSEEINRSYIIGGEKAISSDLDKNLKELSNNMEVSRISGKDRLETNIKVMETFYENKKLENLFVVKDGSRKTDDLVDALSVSSYAAKINSPIILVNENLNENQKEYLSSKKFNKITKIGGNGNENAFEQIKKLFK
ncbi:cell wall-binding repeat-containing protein [Peptacetobacter sp.]|uniref:cell wall-binding repeat-containing protein n=1 Tax=Peptacetobacter sp. TaxID=2991975 RepID=UPI002637ACB7|nr:cell wall-binding repeat-containing protein [Peptacetobacter sp.]